jgi:holo-[acyl-carrier protein] synthase
VIVGVGLDLVPITRVESFFHRWGSRGIEKLFTPGERDYCQAKPLPAQHYAARFAAKEAALKALGVPPALRWHELEVASSRGEPRLLLHGAAGAAAARLGVTRTFLTISHAADIAAAVVVFEAEG